MPDVDKICSGGCQTMISELKTCMQKMGMETDASGQEAMSMFSAMCEPCPKTMMAIGKVPACQAPDGQLAAFVAKPECTEVMCKIKAACPKDPAQPPMPGVQLEEFKEIVK